MTADVMTPAKRSALMARIRGGDTGPELELRRAVWARGLRYRVNFRVGRVRPDLVFVGARLAVFVGGCFWHGCPQHSTIPKNNREFWEQKLRRNRERDAENTQWLEAEGWRVLRLWEHEIEVSPSDCARRIAALLGKSQESKA